MVAVHVVVEMLVVLALSADCVGDLHAMYGGDSIDPSVRGDRVWKRGVVELDVFSVVYLRLGSSMRSLQEGKLRLEVWQLLVVYHGGTARVWPADRRRAGWKQSYAILRGHR